MSSNTVNKSSTDIYKNPVFWVPQIYGGLARVIEVCDSETVIICGRSRHTHKLFKIQCVLHVPPEEINYGETKKPKSQGDVVRSVIAHERLSRKLLFKTVKVCHLYYNMQKRCFSASLEYEGIVITRNWNMSRVSKCLERSRRRQEKVHKINNWI